MTVINAWQHIYSNVEKEQSPQRQRGFQTLFYSHDGLTQTDLQAIERRVFFDVSSAVPYKRQFYSLSGGRRVVAQGVPLPEPDRLGRGGRYLFHSLIIEESDWERINGMPFSIFAQQPFFTQLKDVFEQGDFATGNIQPISLNVKGINEIKRLESLVTTWDNNALIGLGWLALHANVTQKQKPLAVVGTQDVILNTLELVFLLADLESRKHCFFDSHFQRSDWNRTPVWLAGFPQSPSSEYSEISSTSLRSTMASIQPQTPFEHWWMERIRKNEFEEYVTQRDLVVAMDSILQNAQTESDVKRIRAAKPKELSPFSRVNAHRLQSLGEKALSKTLPVELIAAVIAEFTDAPENWWGVILDGLPVQDAANRIDHIYRYDSNPSKREIIAIEQLATQSHYALLLNKIAFWERGKNQDAWGKKLQRMSRDEYSAMAREMIGSSKIDPFDWLSEDKIDTWINSTLPHLSSGQIVATVQYLIGAQRGDLLNLLTVRVDSMSDSDIVSLRKLLQEHAEIAPELWHKILTVNQDKLSTSSIFRFRRGRSSDR